MAYQPKEGSGALFKNDKGDNPARPDYRGDLMAGGVVYEVSGWIKPLASDSTKRFMSLSAKPKQQGQQAGRPQQRSSGENAYAAAKGRAEPAQSSGPDDFDEPPF